MSGFYANKTVLVTGASGFVGTHFVAELLKQGANVLACRHLRPMILNDPRIRVVQADLNHRDQAMRVMQGVDTVIHAAGSVGAAGVGKARVLSLVTENLILAPRIMEAAAASGVERTLVFSSSTAYPPADHAVREEEMWTADPYEGYFGYGWARRAMERFAEFTHRTGPTMVAICRPTAVYGPHDNIDLSTCHVIPALIRRALSGENPFVVWGTGDETRDFLHARDLARGGLLLLERHAQGDPVNIGYGASVTIRKVVEQVLKATGREGSEIVFDANKPTALPHRLVDIGKARRLLGYGPEISLEQGIQETVEWMRSVLSETVGLRSSQHE